MKRVLIIAYYWPPSAGSGVQRWLKFAKYLPQFNWTPVVYTPENPDFDVQDKGLVEEIPKEVEVIKTKIWEPYQWYKRLLGKKSKGSSAGLADVNPNSFKAKFSNWVRGNLFIPDPKVYWVKPSVKFLKTYLKENPVDIIISTGTPHSMHLIALELKRDLALPWIADFRDPWSKLDMLSTYHISKSNFKKYQKLEQQVLLAADLVTTASRTWAKDFEELGAKKAICITNGYDESDFSDTEEQSEKFAMSHFGLINHLRNPSNLWKALNQLCEENEVFNARFELQLGGSIHPDSIEEIKNYHYLKESLVLHDYLPHKEVLQKYQESSVLLLLLFNSESGIGNIPGKLFEYLAAKKPILGFGPGKGDSQEIIKECDAGTYFNYGSDVGEIKSTILKEFNKFEAGECSLKSNVEHYSRENLTARLDKEMETLLN